jgi:hypothetical protein
MLSAIPLGISWLLETGEKVKCPDSLEGVSRPQMAFEGKASRSKNGTTQPSSVRWGFEVAYRFIEPLIAGETG